jgi:hypothetical protein
VLISGYLASLVRVLAFFGLFNRARFLEYEDGKPSIIQVFFARNPAYGTVFYTPDID